ncbi:hypothetical protein FOA43_002230 [Brettanomyces nanus]|uniref:HRDC domain-containing protein n=1 Tax=Eeniella nana TaxID=13502 RepID=A0A875S1U8_EENNA|nr:uncharacterized protein FOA43_002230 [Brettanomyces nanus]QPG74893.1 hypothetical protein FOA43_002230 [Brettanomyces nanus]
MSSNPLEKVAPKLVGLIRLSSALNAKDIDFYKSIDKGIKQHSEETNEEMITLLNKVVQSAVSASTDLNPKDLLITNGNDLENMKVVGNVLDSLFENVEIGLDDYFKARRSGKVTTGSSSNQDGYTYLDETDRNSAHSLPEKMHYSSVPKPQLKFLDKVNNFEIHPFKPLITAKPKSVVPFEESMKLITAAEDDPEHYNNPYAYEIMNMEYPEWIFSPIETPYMSVPWKGSSAPTWVDDPSQLDDLLTELVKCKVIGVDLEHHDYRTYHGLTSLMQISTDTKKDYLIDPLSPALKPCLNRLNVVFADPKIIKVFHGAFMDMIWLQRDLGLYVVSLFDTYWAAKELALGKYSLAFLLEKYVRFRTSKKWQLADWRIRPLSPEMMNYAKADTHFLIELFCKIQADLVNKPGALRRVLYESRKVSNRRFEYSTYKPSNATNKGVVSTNGSVPLRPEYQDQLFSFNSNRDAPWINLMQNNGLLMSKGPIVEALYKWRDNEARTEDESQRFVMSDFVLASLANAFNPETIDQITETNVLTAINRSARFGSSLFVRKYVKELTKLIREVMKQVLKMDIKAWDFTTGTDSPQMASNLVADKDDVYESIKDAERLEEEFEDFYSQYKKVNFGGDGGESKGHAKFEKEKLSDVWSVEYGKKCKFVKGTEVKKRLHKAIEHLKEYEEPVLEVKEDGGVEIADNVSDVEEAVEEKEDETNSSDIDEIITLRKHNKGKNKKRVVEVGEEVIDLKKKIMEPLQRRDRRKKRGKKRSFDPYSASSSQNPDIARVKKRKPRDIGKNVVFKR